MLALVVGSPLVALGVVVSCSSDSFSGAPPADAGLETSSDAAVADVVVDAGVDSAVAPFFCDGGGAGVGDIFCEDFDQHPLDEQLATTQYGSSLPLVLVDAGYSPPNALHVTFTTPTGVALATHTFTRTVSSFDVRFRVRPRAMDPEGGVANLGFVGLQAATGPSIGVAVYASTMATALEEIRGDAGVFHSAITPLPLDTWTHVRIRLALSDAGAPAHVTMFFQDNVIVDTNLTLAWTPGKLLLSLGSFFSVGGSATWDVLYDDLEVNAF